MTDLKRMIAYAQGERFCTARESSEMGNEIARILSVLLRVREGGEITIKKSPQFKHRIEIHASWDTLRALTELLEGE